MFRFQKHFAGWSHHARRKIAQSDASGHLIGHLLRPAQGVLRALRVKKKGSAAETRRKPSLLRMLRALRVGLNF